MGRKTIALAALASLLLAVAPGAGEEHDENGNNGNGEPNRYAIGARSYFFEPSRVQAKENDLIEWLWGDTEIHNVTAYQGANFASGDRLQGSRYEITFEGGTAKYRCTRHSEFDDQGRCTGMCGIVTDDTNPPPPPVIITPQDGASLDQADVHISGTASPDTGIVRLADRVGQPSQRVTLGEAVPENGAWSKTLRFGRGTHTVAAYAYNDAETESGAASVTFTVTVDTNPPEVTIDHPPRALDRFWPTGAPPGFPAVLYDLTRDIPAAHASPLFVRGEARDETVIEWVRVSALNRGLLFPGFEVEANCPGCGVSGEVQWEVMMNLPSGWYWVWATASDGTNTTASTLRSVLIVSGNL